jgi:hypothetical protein
MCLEVPLCVYGVVRVKLVVIWNDAVLMFDR